MEEPKLPKPRQEKPGAQTPERTLTGYILIIIGGLFLLQQALGVDVWRYSWPLCIMGAGVYLIMRRR